MLGTLLKVLKDGATPNQIAGGFTLGFALGAIPGWPLQVLALTVVLLLFNLNISIAFVGAFLAAGLGWLFDSVLDGIGAWALGVEALSGFYTVLYNNPFLMLTRFNNTVVMGGMVSVVVLAVPVFFAARVGVVRFRERVLPALSKLKVVQAVRSSRFFDWYQRINNLRFW